MNTLNGVIGHVAIGYYFGFRKSLYRVDRELPSGREVVRDLLLAVVVREVLFYYIHRGMHLPSVYKRIHKYIIMSIIIFESGH